MEFETNTRSNSEDELEHAADKRLTVNPLHASVAPSFDPNKEREHERNGSDSAFEFESESTAPAALVAQVSPKQKHSAHKRLFAVSAWVGAFAIFVAVLVALKTYY